MQVIINSPKYGKKTLLLDDIDSKLIQGGVYLSHSGQFLYVRIKPHKTFLHRAIMNPQPTYVVDHINRNTLDNRRSNLQVVTIQENLRNQKRPNNKTGFNGVAVFKDRFTAQIKVNYKKIHLGVFKTIKEAAQARKEAEAKYYI